MSVQLPNDTMNRPLLCECGHSARGHGPRLGEDFHKRCWFCPCDQFVALVLNLEDEEWVGTVEIAERLQVSTSWVRKNGKQLGGEQIGRQRRWVFLLSVAMEWGKRLVDLATYHPTVIHVCSRCGGHTRVRKGRLGKEFVPLDHLPGTCP